MLRNGKDPLLFTAEVWYTFRYHRRKEIILCMII